MARRKIDPDIPRIEWLVAFVGLALVLGTAIFIAYAGYTRGSSPPEISIAVEAVVELRQGYVVKIRAANRGDTTAANVTVEGELRRGSAVAETSEATFQYLPPNSERRGGLYFTHDPRKHELTLKPKGYEVP
jgi:uncharacterized protein (TIGR02588 family)